MKDSSSIMQGIGIRLLAMKSLRRTIFFSWLESIRPLFLRNFLSKMLIKNRLLVPLHILRHWLLRVMAMGMIVLALAGLGSQSMYGATVDYYLANGGYNYSLYPPQGADGYYNNYFYESSSSSHKSLCKEVNNPSASYYGWPSFHMIYRSRVILGNPSKIQGVVSGVYLYVYLYGYENLVGQTVTVWSVESTLSDLRGSTTGKAGSLENIVFNDLGQGTSYGSFGQGLSPAGYWVQVVEGTLLYNFIRDKLSAGDDFALGAALTGSDSFDYGLSSSFTRGAYVDLKVVLTDGPLVKEIKTTTPVAGSSVKSTTATLATTIANDESSANIIWSITPSGTITGGGSVGNRTASVTFPSDGNYQVTCTATKGTSTSTKTIEIVVDQALQSFTLKSSLNSVTSNKPVDIEPADGFDQFNKPMKSLNGLSFSYTLSDPNKGSLYPPSGPKTTFTPAAGALSTGTNPVVITASVDVNGQPVKAQVSLGLMDNPVTDVAQDGPGRPKDAEGSPPKDTKATSPDPIRYATGEIDLVATDINSDGYAPWAVTRSYANVRDLNASPLGRHWYLDQMPFVLDAGTTYLVAFNALSTRAFSKSTMAPLRYEKDQLVAQGNDLVFTDGRGNRWVFYSTAYATAGLAGKLRGSIDAGGNATTMSYNASHQMVSAQRSSVVNGEVVSEQFAYAWNANNMVSGVTRTITRGASSQVVRQVLYDYYTVATDPGAALNQLRSVKILDGTGATLETSYYRYWKSGEVAQDGTAITSGAVGQLKYVWSPRAYARMKQNNLDPIITPATNDNDIDDYATKYFEYDLDGRVTKQILRGEGTDATGTSTYAYFRNNIAEDANWWKTKTIETLADNTKNIVYSNASGQTLAFQTLDPNGNNMGIHAYRYDNKGRQLWHMTPAAVTGISGSNDLGLTGNDALNVRNDKGLIEVTVYGGSTSADTSTPGNIEGLIQRECVQEGEFGTPQTLRAMQYILHSGN